MRWYAETGTRRVRQLVADVALLLWVALWWRTSRFVRDLVDGLAAPGRGLADGSDRLVGGFEDVAGAVEGTPLVGGALRAPFDGLAGAADAVGDAGRAQEAAAVALATWSGRLVFLVPVVLVAAVWLWARWRGARELGVATRLREEGGSDLLALRALVTRPATELLEVSTTPADDWRRGRVDDLAALQLRALGLRTGRSS